MIVLILLYLYCVADVYSYSVGAGELACYNGLEPGHGYDIQTVDCPYTVITPQTYTPGTSINITLSGSEIFKGFLVIATDKLDGTIGQFLGDFDADLARDPLTKKTCNDGALTHFSRLSRTELRITWNAPSSLSGSIKFYASFVKQAEIYWVRQPSIVVRNSAETTISSAITDNSDPTTVVTHGATSVLIDTTKTPSVVVSTLSITTVTEESSRFSTNSKQLTTSIASAIISYNYMLLFAIGLSVCLLD